jgi:hypothetical protein
MVAGEAGCGLVRACIGVGAAMGVAGGAVGIASVPRHSSDISGI